MARSCPKSRAFAVLAACTVGAAAWVAPAQASPITTSSPTLPLLGVPYGVPGGTCFTIANFCAGAGGFTFTAPVNFVQTSTDELITTNATYTGVLANASHVPIGTITLAGTIEQDVLGRLNNSDQGAWTDDLVSIALSGTVAGHTLTMTLDPAHTSSGTTSVAQKGAGFVINSFFDVFADLTYDSSPPLHAMVGPVMVQAGSVPEPATPALLAGPLLAMAAVRRRRG